MTSLKSAAAALAIALAIIAPGRAAFAQSNPSASDIQRIQNAIDDTARDISQLRSRDSALASELQRDLDDAREEAVYLKVKQRKGEPFGQNEVADLRDRVDRLDSRARNQSARSTATTGSIRDYDPRASSSARSSSTDAIATGTEFDVRLQSTLSSKTAQVEDKFEATTLVDLKDREGRVLVPAGSVMRGIVSSVKPAGRVERKGSLTVAFDRLTVNGRSYPIRATVTQALESEGIKGEAGKIGVGAGAGAIIGAILGGAKGALAGILIGGGGTIAATDGTDVELQPGTVLRVRLDSELDMR